MPSFFRIAYVIVALLLLVLLIDKILFIVTIPFGMFAVVLGLTFVAILLMLYW